MEARHPYTVARGSRKPWRFVLNSKDVMQASGDRQVMGNNTIDDVFMSYYDANAGLYYKFWLLRA